VKISKILAAMGVISLIAAMYFSISKVYPFNWSLVIRYYMIFIKGLLITLKVSAASLIISFFLGLCFALFRRSNIEFLQNFSSIYVWFFRNTPLLVIILLTYYGVGTIFQMNRFWASVIALSLFEGAYMTEILRSGMEAVNKGEIEAARSLGMSEFQIFTTVIFPQAIRISLPPLIGQMVSLIKDSSLASVIALEELTMMGRQVGTKTLASFESYLVVAVLYVTITSVISLSGRIIERRLSLP